MPCTVSFKDYSQWKRKSIGSLKQDFINFFWEVLSFSTRISVREVVLMNRKSPIMTLFCFGWFPIKPSLALQPTPIYLLEFRRRSNVCIYNDLPDSFQLFPFGAAQCAINIWSVNILARGYFALVRFFDILIINNLNGNLI